jgi:hypothetical protein
MIRSIAGDEPADEVGANVELLEDFPPRPELDALAVLGGSEVTISGKNDAPERY